MNPVKHGSYGKQLRSLGIGLVIVGSVNALADYEVVEFQTGAGIQQSVLISDAGLHVLSATKSGPRTHEVFGLPTIDGPISARKADSKAALHEKAVTLGIRSRELPETVIFADEIRVPSGVEVALIHRDQAVFAKSGEVILDFTSLYNAPVFEAVPQFDAFRDLNGDGLDDFLIPTFEGYQVAIQKSNGGFTEPQTLDAKPLMDMSYNSHPWYQARSIFVADMTDDGRLDLTFWEQGSFRIYAQNEQGRFNRDPLITPTPIPLDYDSVDGMSVRFSNEDQSDKVVTVIHSVADYDGDGVTDLMAMRVKSEGVFRKTTTFSLYAGEYLPAIHGRPAAVSFASTPQSSIESNGIQYDMVPRDLDADGDLDLMVSSVELGVGKVIGALLTSSIKVDLGFYLMDQGAFVEKPATTRNITVTFNLSSGEYWLPAVKLIDHNLDGRMDLLLQESESELRIFEGEATAKVFSTKGIRLNTPLPKDPDNIRQIDVNRDGVDDLVMQIPPPLGEKTGHRAVILLSKP